MLNNKQLLLACVTLFLCMHSLYTVTTKKECLENIYWDFHTNGFITEREYYRINNNTEKLKKKLSRHAQKRINHYCKLYDNIINNKIEFPKERAQLINELWGLMGRYITKALKNFQQEPLKLGEEKYHPFANPESTSPPAPQPKPKKPAKPTQKTHQRTESGLVDVILDI